MSAQGLVGCGGAPPVVGGVDFLVYGECSCGWRCACPEGYLWPHCPLCGGRAMPPPAAVDGEARLGYSARLVPEQQALADARAGGYETDTVQQHYSPEQHARWKQWRDELDATAEEQR